MKKSVILDRVNRGKFVLIAEIGVNYYDIAVKEGITPMQAAKLMIKEAKSAGIHAVKFQTYKAENLAVKESPSYWDISEESETSQYGLFKRFDSFGKEEYEELARYCEKMEIEFLSTAFDIEAADYLYDLMNIYKISSSDLNNLPFIEYQAMKRKPIILSVGASNREEIERAIQLIRRYNKESLTLLHCVLEYPTPYEHANLNKIMSLKEVFPECIIGYSDHTKTDLNYEVLKTAYNLGAVVIEKHFTLDKTLKGNDHYHAMDVKDAKNIIRAIDYIDKLRGSGEICSLESEQAARENARRSVVIACDVKKGTRLTADMLTLKRPGTGIPANEFYALIGRKCCVDIKKDTIMQYEFLTDIR